MTLLRLNEFQACISFRTSSSKHVRVTSCSRRYWLPHSLLHKRRSLPLTESERARHPSTALKSTRAYCRTQHRCTTFQEPCGGSHTERCHLVHSVDLGALPSPALKKIKKSTYGFHYITPPFNYITPPPPTILLPFFLVTGLFFEVNCEYKLVLYKLGGFRLRSLRRFCPGDGNRCTPASLEPASLSS